MKDRKLVFSVTKKDFDISFFSGTGAGGQHRNKHQNCVRMTHRDSGVSATAQSSRSRQANTQEAFRSITNNEAFKSWLKIRVSEILSEGPSVAERVMEAMRPENLKIETGPF